MGKRREPTTPATEYQTRSMLAALQNARTGLRELLRRRGKPAIIAATMGLHEVEKCLVEYGISDGEEISSAVPKFDSIDGIYDDETDVEETA